jgi:hypothetical protein
MTLTRRSFMGSILALAAAPAIVRADSLMPRETLVLMPEITGLRIVAMSMYANGVKSEARRIKVGDALDFYINAMGGMMYWSGVDHNEILVDHSLVVDAAPDVSTVMVLKNTRGQVGRIEFTGKGAVQQQIAAGIVWEEV